MATVTYKRHLDSLLPVAERQEGFFTSAQAAEQGVSASALSKIAAAGHLEREGQGIYRITRWPGSKYPGLWPAVLWGKQRCEKVALSHRTALQLYNITDINPDRIDLSLPRETRIRSVIPEGVTVHARDFDPSEVEVVDGLPVTTLYRTFMDLVIDRLARDEVAHVLDSNVLSKWISLADLKQLRAVFDLSGVTRRALTETLTFDESAKTSAKRGRRWRIPENG